MKGQFLLNKKTQRQDDHIQNENDIKMDDKKFEQVKSFNVASKFNKIKILKKKRKNLFVIKNLNNDKKKKLIKDKKEVIKKIEIKNEKLKINRLQENINNNNNNNNNSNRNEKDKQDNDPNTIIQKGFHNFKINNQWDLFLKHICLLIEKENIIEKEFLEHYSFYIHNNFRTIKLEKGFEKIKNFLSNNELLMRESNNFFLEREKEIKKSFEKYKSNQTGNIENKISLSEININNDNCLSENNRFEIIIAAVIQCLLEKEENELNKEENNSENKDNKNYINLRFDLTNFHLNEHSIMCVISGIKFNNNITELDLSENSFDIKSSYWLGKLIKTNINLKKLELRNCNLDNACLSMIIAGLKNDENHLNEDQHGLEKLNLKDNKKIIDTPNEENQICEILKICKLKWLNLTNAQLGNIGISKLFKTYIDLLEKNKVYLENIIIINNNFKNEECLKIIGEALEKPNCTLKSLVLSKNLITTLNNNNQININYFQYLMESIGKNKSIRELYLIGCGIGKNREDIDILYNMLSENKYLTSIRLFNNEINQFSDFHRIIEVFSDYKNNLKNSSVINLDLSKNGCDIKIDDDFLNLIDRLKLEYLDVSQNKMDLEEKEKFRERVNLLDHIKIIY